MRFRFRIGPFTFGKGGARLSLWSGGSGVSIPLSKKKGRTFGKIGIGPVSAYFDGPEPAKKEQRKVQKTQKFLGSVEEAAIEALGADKEFCQKLRSYGVPWRGVQERLKEELPLSVSNRDDTAYKLVPKAMNTIFGEQNVAWKAEKRPSKNGKGQTTWVVVTDASA